ncbi:MAG: ABC transporter substrate-binding protein [Planctomycetota bacterium]
MKLLAALLLGLTLSGCASTTLIVGSDLSNRPFAYVDENGEPAGIEVELVETIARGLGRNVEWRRMEFPELLPACAVGDVDMVAATIGITPEREQSVLFTRPYYTTRIALVTLAKIGSPTQHSELHGQPVHASAGTTSERAVRATLPDAVLVTGTKEASPAVEALTSGEVAAVVMDGPDATRLVASDPTRFRELQPLAEERYAFAVSRTESGLRDAFSIALDALEAGGVLATMATRAIAPQPATTP